MVFGSHSHDDSVDASIPTGRSTHTLALVARIVDDHVPGVLVGVAFEAAVG